MSKKIAFQGVSGAYSDMACRIVCPGMETLPCLSFEQAFTELAEHRADLAMIPIENTLAGRVADVHYLLSRQNVFIVAEHFQPIHHCLLGVKGADIQKLRHVHSHIHALPQCRKIIAELRSQMHVAPDTASAAKFVKETADPAHAAISSELAAEIYDLEILKNNIQDEHHNTTRFLVLANEPDIPAYLPEKSYITSLIFKVRNIPAALYKSLGGFATNGLSLTKLESYVSENFEVARFYCDVLGHPEQDAFKIAIEELGFYAEDVTFLGTYAAHPFRNLKQTK